MAPWRRSCTRSALASLRACSSASAPGPAEPAARYIVQIEINARPDIVEAEFTAAALGHLRACGCRRRPSRHQATRGWQSCRLLVARSAARRSTAWRGCEAHDALSFRAWLRIG